MKKPKKTKEIITLEQWCDFFSEKMASEVFHAFEDELPKVGYENYATMIQHFMAGFVSAVVYRFLVDMPAEIKEKKAQYEYAMESFSHVKDILSESVSAGVQGGIQTWSGKSIEYYTTIKPVPEPVNKEWPC